MQMKMKRKRLNKGIESGVFMRDESGSWDEIAVHSIKLVKSGLL